MVADKGYRSNETLVALTALGLRSYVSEPDRGRRRWRGKHAARDAVYANRRRIRRPRGRRLLRQRGERLERPHAHLYETGRLRRLHLRGHANIRKRFLVHACGLNLGLLMRRLTGVGTPRGLQGRVRALFDALQLVLSRFWRPVSRSEALVRRRPPDPVVDKLYDAESPTPAVRATGKPFDHGLLEAAASVLGLVLVGQGGQQSAIFGVCRPFNSIVAAVASVLHWSSRC